VPSDIPSIRRELEDACARGEVSPGGVCRSLEAKLRAAQAALERGQPRTAANQLRAFIAELQAQRGKHVAEAAYLRLRAGAEAVIAALG
jgi:hypothetical protein